MHCSAGILFNHESPLRPAGFVTRKVTLGLARIRRGEQRQLELGNLGIHRDWGFAGDYVEGMWRMLQQPEGGDYVLATGRTHSLRSFIEIAGAALGFDIVWQGEGVDAVGVDRKSGRQLIAVNPAFYRPADVDIVLGNPGKAEAQLDWRRHVGFPDLVQEMARADYDRVSRGTVPG
jgi:GDPmannose 4,6-dehydratase